LLTIPIVLETHLGAAGKRIGYLAVIPAIAINKGLLSKIKNEQQIPRVDTKNYNHNKITYSSIVMQENNSNKEKDEQTG
jgi:hypothetical protein